LREAVGRRGGPHKFDPTVRALARAAKPVGRDQEETYMEVCIGQCHGGWETDDGFVVVPSGTTLFLFQEPGESMLASYADRHSEDSAAKLQELQGKAFMKVPADSIVPDYSTSPLGEKDANFFKENLDPDVVVTGSEGEHLSDYLKQAHGANVYWFACQAFMETDLDQIFGETLGSALAGIGKFFGLPVRSSSTDLQTMLEAHPDKVKRV
jgi:hypothetical protein